MSNDSRKHGKRRLPVLAGLYKQYLTDEGLAVFIRGITQLYTCGTLQRLSFHADVEIRRAAIVALGFVGQYDANHAMGRAMTDDDRIVRLLAQNGIRSVWNRDGNQQQRQQLANLVRMNAAGRFRDAVASATGLIQEAPGIAEAWYQRGVGLYQLGDYSGTLRDCHQALELNPYHFVAAAMMGDAYLQLGDHAAALEAFRRAQRVNPDRDRVNEQIARLARQLEGK